MATKVEKSKSRKVKTKVNQESLNKEIMELSKEANRKAHLRFMEDLIRKRKAKV